MASTSDPWHLDKRVPVALIFAILMQTGTAFWWAASIQQRVQTAETNIIRLDSRTDQMRAIAQAQAVQFGRMEEQIAGLRSDVQRLVQILERRAP